MPLYRLNSSVTLRENFVQMDGIDVFECNTDALEMLKVMREFTEERKSFDAMEIVKRLGIEETEDNVFAIKNAILYLRGSFIIDEC